MIEMRTRTAEASMFRPRLPSVLKEIAEKLLEDNWCRISTPNRDRFYYIVGFNEQTAELNGHAEFSIWDFPLPTAPGPLAESVSRSQVAEQNNYLENARKDLERAGVPHDAILSSDLTKLRKPTPPARNVALGK